MELKDIPEFVNREKELKQFKALLSGRPNLIYFVYGPINSGKTALLTKVFKELSGKYAVFYINFRGRYVQTVEDLIKVLFRVKREMISGEIKEFIKEILKGGAKVLEKLKGIPIPENVFEVLFKRKDKVEDIFAFLEEYFEEVREEGYQPIFVLDEIQTIKELINTQGRPLIHELFNFMVRLTKETHLCHCLCATSDCLFIESVYNNARLEGRAKYILVDDMGKESAFEVYESFGFKNKELIWDYIGGKIGDIISLYEDKKQGYAEETSLTNMLKLEVGKLRLIEGEIFQKYGKEGEKFWEYLERFKDGEREDVDIKKEMNYLFFWIERNVLFYNPVTGTVRPQGRLIQKAIKILL